MSKEENTPIINASKISIAITNSLVLNFIDNFEYKKQIGYKVVVNKININEIASIPK